MQDNTKIKETILTHYLIDLSENENALFKVQLLQVQIITATVMTLFGHFV